MIGRVGIQSWRFLGLMGLKFLLVGCLGGVVFLVLRDYQISGVSEQAADATIQDAFSRYAVGGPVFTELRDGRPVKSFAAREFTIQRRRFLAFQSKAVQEAIFKDVHLRLYRYRADAQSLPDSLEEEVGGMIQGILPRHDGGGQTGVFSFWSRVTQLVLAPLTLELWMDQAVTLRLQAASAVVGQGSGRIRFSQAILENPFAHQKITSAVIDWNKSTRSFEIPGAYFAESPKGQATAKGLRVGLDFTLSAM
ncbi:MAG: hypothetical protein HQL98_02865 [Magnetococcales bacterium]|nr:hypothetical protein [Magnetococcales bacterium]